MWYTLNISGQAGHNPRAQHTPVYMFSNSVRRPPFRSILQFGLCAVTSTRGIGLHPDFTTRERRIFEMVAEATWQQILRTFEYNDGLLFIFGKAGASKPECVYRSPQCTSMNKPCWHSLKGDEHGILPYSFLCQTIV